MVELEYHADKVDNHDIHYTPADELEPHEVEEFKDEMEEMVRNLKDELSSLEDKVADAVKELEDKLRKCDECGDALESDEDALCDDCTPDPEQED